MISTYPRGNNMLLVCPRLTDNYVGRLFDVIDIGAMVIFTLGNLDLIYLPKEMTY